MLAYLSGNTECFLNPSTPCVYKGKKENGDYGDYSRGYMKDWNTKYQKRVRISQKNYDRLTLTQDGETLSAHLDKILSLYFDYKGGKREKRKLEKRLNKFNTLI